MLEFISQNAGAIWSIVCSAAAIASGVVAFFAKRSGNTKVLEAMNKISARLPSLITLAETVNPGKTGEEKKIFVLDMIADMLVTMGISLDSELADRLSKNIDSIVQATKQMHVEGAKKRDESHIGNVLN